jgi:hypothetical protein
MRTYENYGDMNYILNELFDKDVIQDFRDKGSVAWVLFESIPLVIYAPYGKRYEYIIVAPYLTPEEETSYFSTRSPSLYEGISLAYIRLMKVGNNAHLLQLDYIDDNETVYLEMESYEYYQT